MNRRTALRLLATTTAAAALWPWSKAASRLMESSMSHSASSAKMPVIFLAHGSPMLLDSQRWIGELKQWADAMPRPRAVLMISAHWDQRPVSLGAARTVPLVYDFYGFPDRYYQVTYPAPGAPELAVRVRELLRGAKTEFMDESERGLDHGAYVPMKCMYPNADMPTLQLSLPGLEPATVYELGKTLAPLHDEGILIIGSGFLTHNLRAISDSTPAWASEFDAWIADVLTRDDVDALLDYRARAPGVEYALPTDEHFVPVILAKGAVSGAHVPASFPITGFVGGSLTRRSVQFG
jgi:4,5-DOPA dioxygenase extradiol